MVPIVEKGNVQFFAANNMSRNQEEAIFPPFSRTSHHPSPTQASEMIRNYADVSSKSGQNAPDSTIRVSTRSNTVKRRRQDCAAVNSYSCDKY
jgi:hypothetical protein